jgi:anhydro-N-acetylmuramic acid kinase
MLLFSAVSTRIVDYSQPRRCRVLGCMSGTSVDGIDVACVELELDGDELRCVYRGLLSVPFPAKLRERIVAALPPGLPGAGELCRLHAELGDAYAEAFRAAASQLAGGEADLAVLHGQTFYHWVDETGRALGTLQLGNASAVAERVGLPVISDLRSRDMAAGGQGAPLVSMFDLLLLSGRTGPSAAVNLGGIANITVVDAGRVLTGYDVGPAGALMDPAAGWATGTRAFDAGGAIAATGAVSEPLLALLKAEPYYRLSPPRSTGRELFNASYLTGMLSRIHPRPAAPDVLATVTRLLVDLLAQAAARHGLAELILSGGGSANATTVRWLREAAPGVRVLSSDDLGLPARAKEAVAFAVLGFLTWHGLPGSVTAATGAQHPCILGSIQPGAGPLLLPAPAPRGPRYLRLYHSSPAAGSAAK